MRILFPLCLLALLTACAPAAERFPQVAHAAANPTTAATAPRTPVPTWTLPFDTPSALAASPTSLAASATPLPVLLTPDSPVYARPPLTELELPTQTVCTATHGTVITTSIPSAVLHYAFDAHLYLPPCYDQSAAQYPVLYLLHGLGFTDDQWDRLGAPATADALIASGEIAPLIIVMPRDRRDSRLDPALVKDLLPYIDANYRTRPERAYRAIGGLSRGAGWAIHFGLHYPELFGRMGAHSPAIFYTDEKLVLDWLRHLEPAAAPAIYFDIGENDANRQSAVWMDQLLTWFKIDYTYKLQPGTHNEKYWSAHVADYLRFYAGDWLAAPPATPGPNELGPQSH